MAYFKIGDTDFFFFFYGLKVNKNAVYNSQTNASGDTLVDYIKSKRTIEVGIIPVDETIMLKLQLAISSFSVSISFLNPATNELAENVNCIIPADEVEYYTIRAKDTSFKALTLTFIEL